VSKTATAPLDPATRLVRSLEGEYFKLSEAAEMLKVPESTLRALIKDASEGGDPDGAPKQYIPFGKIPIYLYTRDDIERIRGVLTKRRQASPVPFDMVLNGRPPRYTPEERAARTKLSARAWYYRNRIKTLQAASEPPPRGALSDARRKLKEIETELKTTEKP